MPGALDGTRVIDFGQYIAGPLTGMLLADQGADVIKVDPPGGPRWKTPANATWNRGKRSILLDLNQADDLATARALVRGADVVVENFRPGVMNRLGLGPEEMTRANPRLVYCSLPGFASDDPRAGVAAYEGVVGAATAAFLIASGHTPPYGRAAQSKGKGKGNDRPVYNAIPTASAYGAFQAAVSIAMALYVREREGVGQHIEVPLFDAMFVHNAYRGIGYHDPSIGVTYPYSSGRFLEPQHYRPWDGFFQCKDGRWLYFNGATNQNWRQFVEAAGITSWDAEGLTDFDLLKEDPKLAAEALRRAEALFKTRTAQEWEDLVAEAGSECAVCRTSQEWIDHPQARESQMVIQINDPVYGKMLQPGINVRMSRTPAKVRGPAPTPDQHREEILSQLASLQPDDAHPMTEATMRAALDGVRVLDLCIELAGPSLGRTLAQFGADVIKIDNPIRDSVIFLHIDINQGKRSLLLDLKTEEGRDVFWRLLDDADVVLQNYRAGKLEKLGLSYEEIRKRKPDIICASLNAYGHSGPWTERPGHDPFAQSATGMALRFGGDGPPVMQPTPINDYGTGFMGAYAVALALLHRQRTGEGQHIDSSLAHTAMTLQSPFMQSYQGKTWDEPRGQDAPGDGPFHRAYRGKDGWLFLGAREPDLPRIAGVEGLEGIEALRGEALAKALEERFPAKSVEAWVSQLNAADIGAHRVVPDFAELMVDPWVKAHGLSLTREHDEMGLVTTCGPAFRLSRTPVRPGHPAPKPGRHAQEIMEEHGLGGDYKRLVETEVVVVEGVRAG
jgi:crotonobetainyl-CoA:carnitine CoA-transferase CaiB-like acyl-CoA transferase